MLGDNMRTGRLYIAVTVPAFLVASQILTGIPPAVAGVSPDGLMSALVSPVTPSAVLPDREANFRVSVSYSGSACGDGACRVEVRYGGRIFPVSAGLPSGGNMTVTVSLFNPDKPGRYPTSVRLLSGSGAELAAAPSGDIVVNGVVSRGVSIKISATRTYAGQPVTVSGYANRTDANGATSSRNFKGRVYLQFQRTGSSSWSALDSVDAEYESGVSFTVTAKSSGQYRLYDQADSVTSSPAGVVVVQPSGRYRVGSTRVSSKRVPRGTTIGVGASVQAGFADGSWRQAPPKTRFTLQFRTSGSASWRNVKSGLTAKPGWAQGRFTVRSSGQVRIVVAGAVARPVSVSLMQVVPTSLRVSWPSVIYDYSDFSVRAWIQTNAGTYYGRSVRLVLQYRASRLQPWRDVDAGYSSGRGPTVLISQFGFAGYYRVYAPSLGWSNGTSYS